MCLLCRGGLYLPSHTVKVAEEIKGPVVQGIAGTANDAALSQVCPGLVLLAKSTTQDSQSRHHRLGHFKLYGGKQKLLSQAMLNAEMRVATTAADACCP